MSPSSPFKLMPLNQHMVDDICEMTLLTKTMLCRQHHLTSQSGHASATNRASENNLIYINPALASTTSALGCATGHYIG